MKKQRQKQITYVTAVILLVVMLVISFLVSGGVRVYAAVSKKEAYESSNVWNDLTNATIDGEVIDLSQYNIDETKSVQLLSFVEFGYSEKTDGQGDYGLYVYIYNPGKLDLLKKTSLNKISLRYTGKTSSNFEKYQLTYLNRSEKAGYEGLFYKFRVELTASQRTAILNALNSSSRVYEVSEIELYSSGTNATAYAVSNTYTFTGYAKGYGSDNVTSDTLTCTVDGIEEVLQLDVHTTYWRPKGTHSDGYTRDTLHSVYFSVPNEIIEAYGEMTAVHATWLNAYTAPILVTGNKDIYSALYPYIAEYVEGGTIKDYSREIEYALVATKAVEGQRDSVNAAWAGYYAYNAYLGDTSNGALVDNTEYDKYLCYLNYLFYAENADADNYVLPAEKLVGDKTEDIKGWFETFTERFGNIVQDKVIPNSGANGEGTGGSAGGGFGGGGGGGRSAVSSTVQNGLVNGKYSAVLFESVESAFTDITIESDDTYKLTDNTVSDTIWNRLFGNSIKKEHSYEMSAIQRVTVDDLSYYPDKTIFCDKFYVDESDYDSFSSYIRTANKNNETVYLFRYYQSEYVSNEVTEYKRTSQYYLFQGNYGTYKTVDTNAYFCQMWVQLDFDIIDVTFSKDGVKVVIPVVMSPMDIAADAAPPVSTQPDKFVSDFWKYAVVITGILLFVLIITRIVKGRNQND